MGCAIWPHVSGEYFYYLYLGRPFPTLIHRDMDPLDGQTDRKSSKNFVFGYWTWGVQSNRHMMGIIFVIRTGQWTPLFFGRKFSPSQPKCCLFSPREKKLVPGALNEPPSCQSHSDLKNWEAIWGFPDIVLAFYKFFFCSYLKFVWLWILFVSPL